VPARPWYRAGAVIMSRRGFDESPVRPLEAQMNFQSFALGLLIAFIVIVIAETVTMCLHGRFHALVILVVYGMTLIIFALVLIGFYLVLVNADKIKELAAIIAVLATLAGVLSKVDLSE
jgi:hypothetical protein